MTDLMKEVHDLGLFFQAIVLVAMYTGLAVVPVVLLVRGLFQAYLMRNVADRSRR